MGKQFKAISLRQQEFILKQPLFFVATAMADGKINVSPKGLDTFRIVAENEVLWLNVTGSGNETAVHLKNDGRMTIMFCAFEGAPQILRLYGYAKAYHYQSSFWEKNIGLFPEIAGARQLIQMNIELVQSSCGMAVPLMDFKQQRNELVDWAEDKGIDGLKEYWRLKNTHGLDGHVSEIFSEDLK